MSILQTIKAEEAVSAVDDEKMTLQHWQSVLQTRLSQKHKVYKGIIDELTKNGSDIEQLFMSPREDLEVFFKELRPKATRTQLINFCHIVSKVSVEIQMEAPHILRESPAFLRNLINHQSLSNHNNVADAPSDRPTLQKTDSNMSNRSISNVAPSILHNTVIMIDKEEKDAIEYITEHQQFIMNMVTNAPRQIPALDMNLESAKTSLKEELEWMKQQLDEQYIELNKTLEIMYQKKKTLLDEKKQTVDNVGEKMLQLYLEYMQLIQGCMLNPEDRRQQILDIKDQMERNWERIEFREAANPYFKLCPDTKTIFADFISHWYPDTEDLDFNPTPPPFEQVINQDDMSNPPVENEPVERPPEMMSPVTVVEETPEPTTDILPPTDKELADAAVAEEEDKEEEFEADAEEEYEEFEEPEEDPLYRSVWDDTYKGESIVVINNGLTAHLERLSDKASSIRLRDPLPYGEITEWELVFETRVPEYHFIGVVSDVQIPGHFNSDPYASSLFTSAYGVEDFKHRLYLGPKGNKAKQLQVKPTFYPQRKIVVQCDLVLKELLFIYDGRPIYAPGCNYTMQLPTSAKHSQWYPCISLYWGNDKCTVNFPEKPSIEEE